MLSIAMLVNSSDWKSHLSKDRAFFRSVLTKAFSYLDLPKRKFNVSVVFSHDAEIQELNKTYRGKNKPTNVLSFPQYDNLHKLRAANDNLLELGDIVLAFETIKREAKEQKKTIKNHTAHLLVHGLLHLCGYDHLDDKDAEDMETTEIAILKALKIKNPYA